MGSISHRLSSLRTDAMAGIDVSADDKGLHACLAMAHVKDTDAKPFTGHHEMVTLEDFVYLVQHDAWESGVQDLVEQVASLKDQKTEAARAKAARSTGREALKQAAVPSAKACDVDELLPDNQMKAMNSDWTKRYNLQFDPSLEPAEALRARVFREFKKGQMSVIEARKVKSMVAIATPKQQEKVSMGSEVELEFQKPQRFHQDSPGVLLPVKNPCGSLGLGPQLPGSVVRSSLQEKAQTRRWPQDRLDDSRRKEVLQSLERRERKSAPPRATALTPMLVTCVCPLAVLAWRKGTLGTAPPRARKSVMLRMMLQAHLLLALARKCHLSPHEQCACRMPPTRLLDMPRVWQLACVRLG